MLSWLKTWLKKHFIPHAENDHRPHFLHTKNTRAILALVLAFELLLFVLPSLTFVERVNTTNLASVLPAVLSALTNKERIANNTVELVVSPILTQAAELKAKDMAEKSYFAHTSPEGKTPWYWLDLVGYEYDYAGENLAINFSDSRDVTEAWMDSPSHRANIVKASYKEVGTGIATGVFEGEKTIFVAQIYANPHQKKSRIVELAIASEGEIDSSGAASNELLTEPSQEVSAEVLIASEEVLGATIAQNSPQTPAPADKENPTGNPAGQESRPAPVLVSQVETEPSPTVAQRAFTSPRHATNIIFLIILSIVVLAVIINIFVRFDVQHPDLITNGLFVVTVILAVLTINNFLGQKDIAIGQTFDYSKAEVRDNAL